MIRDLAQRVAWGVVSATMVAACAGAPAPPAADAPVSLDTPEIAAALKGMSGDRIKQHMTVLAGDELEGRGLGSAGYEGALRYVETTLTSQGLAPAGENGGFRQRVPLRNSVVVQKASSMVVTSPSGKRTLTYGKDYLLSADPLREDASLADAPVVFVGYGVSAPGLGYDDYAAGVDLKGKVVAYLSGAPAKLPSNARAY